MEISIDSDLADILKMTELFPEESAAAARMAINDVAKGPGMKMIRAEIMDEVNFKASYLTGDRLYVSKKATNSNPEAVITARDRPTSLARFASGTPASTKGKGVTVTVKKGRAIRMDNAFLVRLRAGKTITEDNFNVGLAIRVKNGKVNNKKEDTTAWLVPGKVALLYGPSVAQVFDDVRDDVAEPIAEDVATEYLRQLSRLLGE